jgi:hypothetical protein
LSSLNLDLVPKQNNTGNPGGGKGRNGAPGVRQIRPAFIDPDIFGDVDADRFVLGIVVHHCYPYTWASDLADTEADRKAADRGERPSNSRRSPLHFGIVFLRRWFLRWRISFER